MKEALLESLDVRVTLVVGKGGVGKTTVAGSLSLLFADLARPTHLVSTDPAHSLADLFGVRLRGGEVRRRVCGAALSIEEFDATGALEEWLGRAEAPIRELVEAGTYLDEEDARPFLEGVFPGADEAMAALRLVELASGEADRILVDTAPSGHTLRLLDAGDVLSSWHAALHAMARKGAAVASRFARRPVRLESEDFVDELGTAAEGYRHLLGEAACVLVSRPDAPVRAETARLRNALARRGIRLAAEVVVGRRPAPANGGRPSTGAPVLAVPATLRPRGCEELRRWMEEGGVEGEGVAEGKGGADGGRTDPGAVGRRRDGGDVAAAEVSDILPGHRRTLLFVGKGGVGKTTCAVACAAALSGRMRTTLLSTDPAGSLRDVLGVGEAPAADGVEDGLAIRQLDAEAALEEFRARNRESFLSLAERLGLDDRLALDRAVLESLLEVVPPGIDELFALAALTEASPEDVLVVDSSPTGHFLRLLQSPKVAREWLRATMRILLRYRSATGLGDLAERLLRATRRIERLQAELVDPEETGAVVVTLDEPMVLAETRRLCEALGEAGVPVAALLVNRVDPAEMAVPAGVPDRCGSGTVPLIAAPDREAPIVGREDALAFFRSWSVPG